MGRVKATTTDIHSRLARGECANYRAGNCLGKNPCTIIHGEACDYFASYVLPLLDYPEFSNKYVREAKITVALNPQSKVVRKRRQTAIVPTLAFDASKPAISTVNTPSVKSISPVRKQSPVSELRQIVKSIKPEQALTTVVSVEGDVSTKPRVVFAAPKLDLQLQASSASKHSDNIAEIPQLLLELCSPDEPRRKVGRRR